MAEIEVPPFFLCPISLQIMKDPVTVSTGISYDRDAIERWISAASSQRDGGAPTCPVTKQPLQVPDLIPNITLRRLIQSWCTLNAVDRLPTPKTPRATRAQIKKLLEDLRSPPLQLKSLQALKVISAQSQTNLRLLESAVAAAALATIVVDNSAELSKNCQFSDDLPDSKNVINEALSILYSLQLSESNLKSLTNSQFVETLTLIMQQGSYDDSRVYAVMLLNTILEGSDPSILINLPLNLFAELGQILKDQISEKATKSALETLISCCEWWPNRIKAANSGVVPVLIELLLESSHRRASEMALMLLNLLCQCAEGRSALLTHRAGLAIISKKILRVSRAASDSAVSVLHSISRFSATREVLQEMLQIGVVKKLCLVIQVDCGAKTREKARDVLRMHARTWKTSAAACIPSGLMSLYPAS